MGANRHTRVSWSSPNSVYESAGVASLLEGRATRQELVTLKGVASAVSVYRVAGVGPEPASRWSPS